MDRRVETILPSNPDGVTRNFAIEHVGHSDIRLEFWDGDIAMPSLIESFKKGVDNPYPRYALPHTFHGLLMAALMGYLTRIGTPEQGIEETLHDARVHIETKKPHYRPNNLDVLSLLRTSQGFPMSRYDIPEKGWLALTRPIVTEPGVQFIGGSELFTTEASELVIAKIADKADDGSIIVTSEHATILTERDISPIATAIAKISLGESIDTIGTLFKERFSNK